MAHTKQTEMALFSAARDLTDAGARRAFLDDACRNDPELRDRLEALLALEEPADDFFNLRPPTASRLPDTNGATPSIWPANHPGRNGDATTGELAGTRIGRYKLLQRIGEGGCGVVYLAEQEKPVRRRVALKIIRLGMDTENVIARFEAERQALALMDHPNIARVLDAGATETGRPYFVMELVRGVRITEYCDQNNLDTRQRLGLFIQICHAIQHAHQKSIVHRDIKPSNILVTVHDSVPMPKVIDFGIAKATQGRLTDNTFVTAAQQMIGTPAYMSPEQAEMSGLDVDTRSDIYSLGVLLYELLTGRTPFDGKKLVQSGLDEMRRTLRETEPQPPSTMITTLRRTELTATAGHRHAEPPKLISLLKGDLDWIVMKTLEKDRVRRYDTANGLAMDVQRFLDNEPVVARPPGRYYLFQKLVRRNRVVFAAGAAVASALVLGLGVSTWLFFQEREARQQQVQLREEAELARANEARLRQEAEVREKITQAAYLVSQEQWDQADRLLDNVFVDQPSLENVSVFRALGVWHAIHGNWQKAADCFETLLRVNQKDSWDSATGDIIQTGPAIVELGDARRYEKFRQAAIARFAGTSNPIVAERVIKTSLLVPADARTMAALRPMLQVAEQSLKTTDANNDDWLASWRCISVALMDYRLGSFSEASDWCWRCLSSRDNNPARKATARVILAMAMHGLGQTDAAQSQLTEGREAIESKFQGGLEPGATPKGFWHDWTFARILLREATESIEGTPLPASSPTESVPPHAE